MPPPRATPTNVRMRLMFSEIELLAYISVADSMGLSLFKFVQWAPKEASFLQHSAYLPFKVIWVRWFWYESKARMRLPIIPSLWLWSCLAPFLRHGDLLAKNCVFLPVAHSAPSLPVFPLEFRAEVNQEQTRVLGLSYSPRTLVSFYVLMWC